MADSALQQEVYDEEYFLGHRQRYREGIYQSRILELEASLGEVAGLRVLDSGCGYGYFSHLARQRGARVTALDTSLLALSFVRSGGGDGVGLLSSDALRLGIRDAVFDLVLSTDVIEHLPDTEGYLREIHRVLKSGGRCLVMTNNDKGLFKVPGLGRLYYGPARHSPLRRRLDKIKRRERHKRYDELAHVNLLTVDDLLSAARRVGLRVASWHTFPYIRHRLRDQILDLAPIRRLFRRYLHDYVLVELRKPL